MRAIYDVNDVHDGRRCNIVFMFERRNKCIRMFAKSQISSAIAESWKKQKTSNVVLSFIVCLNQNRSALVSDLLSYNSLYVCQLHKEKSLSMWARDLIFFTTDLQKVN